MTAAASTCAASWRISSRAFGPLLLVRTARWAPSGSGRDRSRTCGPSASAKPVSSTASAARARPGPIAAAASGSSSEFPSGSVIVGDIAALEATRPRREPVGARQAARASSWRGALVGRLGGRCSGGDTPERVVGERLALDGAVSDELDQRPLGAVAIGQLVVLGHDRGDLRGYEAVGEALERFDRGLGRVGALERRVEVCDQHVVGLDRLEAAGLKAPAVGALKDERGR